MNSGIIPIALAVIGLFGGSGGILLFRASASKIRSEAQATRETVAKIRAEAQATRETARKTNEEREGLAVVNADKVVALMDKQMERFEKQITRMSVEAERAEMIRIKDEETIRQLKALLQKEQEICSLRIEALEREIDLLKRQVEANRIDIATGAAAATAATVAAQVVIAAHALPTESTLNVRDITHQGEP